MVAAFHSLVGLAAATTSIANVMMVDPEHALDMTHKVGLVYKHGRALVSGGCGCCSCRGLLTTRCESADMERPRLSAWYCIMAAAASVCGPTLVDKWRVHTLATLQLAKSVMPGPPPLPSSPRSPPTWVTSSAPSPSLAAPWRSASCTECSSRTRSTCRVRFALTAAAACSNDIIPSSEPRATPHVRKVLQLCCLRVPACKERPIKLSETTPRRFRAKVAKKDREHAPL